MCQQARGTYGAPRVHAELRLGYGITVGHNAVAMLMRRAGLQGLSGSRGPRRRRISPADTPADLVDRDFARHGPDQLWVTDIERHEALTNRAVVGGHRLVPVAAGTLKLGAA
ncbi:IS3 family transposase [Candidatus Spongiisocius sp.]|uniref:IS3 family transposase n=1 Tax=Candidatus Spongiisocius sp. TaxID=3101273 RepID=UPI003B5A932F